MSTEQELQHTIDDLADRIRSAVAQELHDLAQEWLAKLAAERETAIGEARRVWEVNRADAVAAEVARVRAETEQKLTTALAAARRQADETLESAVTAVRAEGERAVADARAEFAETLTAQLAAARAEADERLRVELGRVQTEAERALESELRDVVGTRVSERQVVSDVFTRLVNAVRRLDAAPSLTDVLDTLTERVAAEAGRVALFIVQGQRVRGWRIAGFSQLSDARAIDLSFHEAGIIGEAATLAEARTFHVSADGERPAGEPSFVQLPSNHDAVALPLRVGGQVMAVLYADDVRSGERDVPMSWAESTEVLARHAGHALEALTAARAAQMGGPRPARPPAPKPAPEPPPEPAAPPALSAEQAVDGDSEDAARRCARLLLSEIKLYNEADVKRGREERDLFERLRPQIERARTLYEEKIPPTVKARTLYFEQELVRTLADGDPGLLGG